MDKLDFGDDKTGRFVPTLNGNVAFVPNSLDELKLPLDWALVSLLSKADAAVAEVTGACRRQVNPLIVLRPFQRTEAMLSSRIEGTITTAKELAVLEAKSEHRKSTSSRPDLHSADTREVGNYLAALDLGIAQLVKLPLSLRLIRDVHRRLMNGVRGENNTPGEFRRHQAAIGKQGQTEKEARFVPPPPIEMLACLDDFERFLHSDAYPPLIKVALAHYQFEAIHPFGDGNGRTGRLLIPLLMLSERRIEQPILYLSPYFERNDREYRDHLLSVSQHGTWRAWIEFVLNGVISQCAETIARLHELDSLLKEYRSRVTEAPGPLQAIVDDLAVLAVISADQIAQKYDVSHQTAMNWIRRLQSAQVLTDSLKSGRETLYIASRLL